MSNQSGSLGSKPFYINNQMIEKNFTNKELEIELKSFIDKQQNIWFLGKEVAKILGFKDSVNALKRHVSEENKMLYYVRLNSRGGKTPPQQNSRGGETPPQQNGTKGRYYTILNEAGFYELVFGSKMEFAKKFRQWVFNTVLPSIRKYGQYKMFNCPWNNVIMISNETDLHYKVVQLIRRYYPDSILVAGLGENQDTEEKRLDSFKKGYQKGQPDLMILDYHRDYKGLCIEFKSPTNNYCVSEAQLKMKKKYKDNGYAFLLSNDYDSISKKIHLYMTGVRIRCEYCTKEFCNKNTLNKHYKFFHRIDI